jgi:hypothetical protein
MAMDLLVQVEWVVEKAVATEADSNSALTHLWILSWRWR